MDFFLLKKKKQDGKQEVINYKMMKITQLLQSQFECIKLLRIQDSLQDASRLTAKMALYLADTIQNK